MARDNDVFQVLVTKGNQAVLAKDKKVDELAPNQIGIFDANTTLSVDGTTPVKEFFIAVGVDKDGDGVVDSINQSAGQTVQTKGIGAYSFRPHTPGKPMVVEISNFKADCDTEYGIKLEFKNQRIYRIQGFNQFSHTYIVRTSCCDGCEDCPSGDCNELVSLFVNAINLDPKGLVKAEAINPTSGAVVTDIPAFIAANATINSDGDSTNDVCLKLRLTTIPMKVKEFCSINSAYYNPRETVIIPSLVQGFKCSGKITTTQEASFEEGSGYDVKQREYKAGGWNGRPGPYRVSETTLLPSDGFKYFADANTKYDRIALEYQHEATGGWLDYKNDLATEIAIPAVDTVTRDSFLTVVDKIVSPLGFDPLADDAATANVDPTVVEKTSTKGVSKDGLA